MVKSRVPMNSCRARGQGHQHELEPRRSAPAVRALQAQPATEQKWDTRWWDLCFLRQLGKASSRQLSPVLGVMTMCPPGSVTHGRQDQPVGWAATHTEDGGVVKIRGQHNLDSSAQGLGLRCEQASW